MQKAIELLLPSKLDVLYFEDPISLYYLTGLSVSSGKLLIHQKGAALFLDSRYLESAKKKSPCPLFLLNDENIEKTLESLALKEMRVGFDSYTTTYASYQNLEKTFQKMKTCKVHLIPQNRPLRNIRLIKDIAELQAMRKAAALCWKGYNHARSFLKEGISEKDIAIEFEIFCRKHGGERLAFDCIIAFGENSAYPHYRAGSTVLKKNDIVLMDLGVVVDKYCSDFTRTIFFGKPDPELQKVHALVTEAHDKVLELCKPGTQVKDLDQAVRDIFAREKLESNFIHSLGHGLGLEVHEYPLIKGTGPDKDFRLQPGMVLAVEPGIYLPGKGGVRYEDTVLISKMGFENFYET